jgi:UDP-N-acetylmuramoyl-L-alanyl-D-glutamate--2,6-diaminopimelate ligase
MNKPKLYHSDLARLLGGICKVPSALNTQIHGIQSDSRRVKSGDLFVALSGVNHCAKEYVAHAIKLGAAAVLIEPSEGMPLNGELPHEDNGAVELYVPSLREHVGEIAHRFFKAPSSVMQVVGVTGTNGKTSVSHYLAQFFQLVGRESGVIGTLGYGLVGPDEELIDTQHTTPSVVDVHRYLAHLRDAGAEFVAMEVSSHGLSQGRINGVRFEGAVFTNLSRDHLDYHETMERYGLAKSELFRVPSLKYAVINADDEQHDLMAKQLPSSAKLLLYGKSSIAQIQFVKQASALGLSADVHFGSQTMTFCSDLVGDFNLYNLLCVVGVSLAKGLSVNELSLVERIQAVPGRMESYQISGYPQLVVDYAHTPDALKSALMTLRESSLGKVWVVFGCGGDRDVGKRAEMARVAEKYADYAIITDDNPRTESPASIARDIAAGYENSALYEVKHDRSVAIGSAFERTQSGDVILVAGKGHENYQEINGERHHFDDAEVCRALLGLDKEVLAKSLCEEVAQ